MLHGNVPLPAHGALVGLCATLEFARGQAHGLADNGPGLHDADHTGHCDTANTDHSGVVAEDFLLAHGGDFSVAVGTHKRNDDPPYEERTGGDYEGIAQSHNIAQTEHCGSGVAAEHQFGLGGDCLPPSGGRGRERAGPKAERLHHIVVDTAYERGNHKRLGLRSTGFAGRLAAGEHLSGSCSLREGVLAVHILHEIFSEGDEEKYTEDTAKQRAAENLEEAHRNFGIFGLKDVERRESEDCTGHDDAGAGTDALNDYVLPEGILLAQGAGKAHGNDGDGDCSFENLAYFQAEICRGSTENNAKHQAHGHGVRRNLGVGARRMHQRAVGLVGSEFAEGVFRELHGVGVGINPFVGSVERLLVGFFFHSVKNMSD